jgi:hypothetical protein
LLEDRIGRHARADGHDACAVRARSQALAVEPLGRGAAGAIWR